ncbi:MAG: carboxypeptidase regulatory-like domain-containing protein [Saprospiraceae bacterium]|nr:carboxypeptidase regulatory-like domain-containing protein [Saprospiraceae bacterium]
MARYLLLFFMLFLTTTVVVAQTTLEGKVTEQESKEPVIFANVVLFQNEVQKAVVSTDFDGNYVFSGLEAGTYSVEVSYIGFAKQRITGIKVAAGRVNKLDIEMIPEGVVLDEIVVTEYKVPLVDFDNTTQGATITSENIRQLPTRNINALAATTAGLSSSDEGGAVTIRGSRSNATDYYVDGIRVSGNLIPESEIEQLQVITGGVEAQYGDVTGGIISITTKGPSQKFSGGVEVETSEYLDPYRQSLAGFNLSGPIWLRDNGDGSKTSILGFRLSGRYTYQFDDDPPAIDVYRINEAKRLELEANPLIDIGGTDGVAADFLVDGDAEALDYRPNEEFTRYDLTAKIDARLSDAIDITLTGTYNDTENFFTPGGWRLLNSHNNPAQNSLVYRGNFRFRHRLGGPAAQNEEEAKAENSSLIQNAYYQLQFGYQRQESDVEDIRHGDNLFRYGHYGTFDIEWLPSISLEADNNGNPYFLHNDYRPILRSYTPSQYNPTLANFNNFLGIDFQNGEGNPTALNTQVGNYFLPDLVELGDILTREEFPAQNGTIFRNTSTWNFHSNVGAVYNTVNKSEADRYTFNGSANFDIVPGGSDAGRHSIQVGFWYEQRISRSYSVAPRGLWNAMRQLANNHINGVGLETDTSGVQFGQEVGSIVVPGFDGLGIDSTVTLYDLDLAEQPENQFFRSVREMTGQPLNEYVNVDGLNPDDLSLDMFSARELNDLGLIGYFGYDYLGNPFDGNFEEYFTARDPVTGIRTFPVAPNRPIYQAFYVQDRFSFKDIIFRVGVRVDRYDANTKVLKDLFSLYEIMGASDYHSNFGGDRPGNIGDDYKVYLTPSGDAVQAYRNGEEWFRADGTPVNDFRLAVGNDILRPQYVDPAAQEDDNYIRSENYNPEASFEDYEVQVNVMPRLAFSFPISTEANFFAHYDVLVQRPPSNTIATPRDYFYFNETTNQIKNNPNLKPERTIDYEVGFQQKLSNASALKISAYYKELRDMIQERVVRPVRVQGNQYITYDNIDFGTVKGFSFQYDLRRTGNVSLQANYTLQFADGTGSSVSSSRGLNNRGIIRNIFPLSFDERHRINVVADFRYGSGKKYNGPRLFGKDIFSNAGVNLQAIAVSGRPYTENVVPEELGGSQIIGAINGARRPWTFTVNLRVDKSFTIGNKLNFNVYARISNLLDRRNIINVYPVTGSPTDDGFLQSPIGQDQIATIPTTGRQLESYLASYQWALLNPNNFSLPRRIYVGAIFDF